MGSFFGQVCFRGITGGWGLSLGVVGRDPDGEFVVVSGSAVFGGDGVPAWSDAYFTVGLGEPVGVTCAVLVGLVELPGWVAELEGPGLWVPRHGPSSSVNRAVMAGATRVRLAGMVSPLSATYSFT